MTGPVLRLRRRDLLLACAAAGSGLASTSRGQNAPMALDPQRLQSLDAQLRGHAHLRALLIERGEQRHDYYRTDTTATTLLNAASVTKSVVGLLVGVAIERGDLQGVDEPLAAFFPEHASGTRAAALSRVRLRHLLSLSSGFDRQGLAADTDHPDFMRRLYAPGLLDHALGRRLVEEPGSRFYYSNLDAHLAALALSRRLKVPLVEFARDQLFSPLGIGAFAWPAGQDGVANGASELRLTAPDLLKLGRLLRQGGSWQGRQLASRSFLQEATVPKVQTDLPARGRKDLWGYGYLWWLASTPGDDLPAWYAAGYGGQFVYGVPALELVIVALTEQVSREVAARTALLIRDAVLPAVR